MPTGLLLVHAAGIRNRGLSEPLGTTRLLVPYQGATADGHEDQQMALAALSPDSVYLVGSNPLPGVRSDRARRRVEGIDGRSAAQDNCDRRMDPEFPKGPSMLVLEHDKTGKPIHVVWGIPKGHASRADAPGPLTRARGRGSFATLGAKRAT